MQFQQVRELVPGRSKSDDELILQQRRTIKHLRQEGFRRYAAEEIQQAVRQAAVRSGLQQ